MRVLGAALIVLGILAMTYGGFTYRKEHHSIDAGPIHASVEEKKTIPISPVLGGVIVIAGIVLVAMGSRRVS